MNLLSFHTTFPDELSCKLHWRDLRLRHGVVCKKCSGLSHKWLDIKEQFECVSCRFRTTLKSGTIMENSKLPFQYWYLVTHLMTSTKKGFSALEIQRQLGHTRYEPILILMRKIRVSMSKLTSQKRLKDMVEMDEAFVSISSKTTSITQLKRGKGSQKKQAISVMNESMILEDAQGKTSKRLGLIKMNILDNEKKESINKLVHKHIDPDAILFTDKSKSYVDLKRFVQNHIQEISPKIWNTNLKWIHINISNLKRNLLGIYHCITKEYLKQYLDEFCFKLNTRYIKDRFKIITKLMI